MNGIYEWMNEWMQECKLGKEQKQVCRKIQFKIIAKDQNLSKIILIINLRVSWVLELVERESMEKSSWRTIYSHFTCT